MRNILLAITSFFATVLILSQIALAQSQADGGTQHSVSAQGEDPNLAETSDRMTTEGGVPNAGNKCKDGTCYQRSIGGRLGDNTRARPRNSASEDGGRDQKGSQ